MNAKDKVAMRLEGKTVLDLVKEYYEMENKIIDVLIDKKKLNEPCTCVENLTHFRYIDDDAIIEICIRCGGNIER